MSINLPIPWRDVETKMFALNVVSTSYFFFFFFLFLFYRHIKIIPKVASKERWCNYSFCFIVFIFLIYSVVFLQSIEVLNQQICLVISM